MKNFLSLLLFVLMSNLLMAQDKTTVRANSIDISDNLDLRAVATLFGESSDLNDFERRLNDPEIQISNLDLNNDNMIDYLRVIEHYEGNTHLIIVQAVLGKDIFQDVATIEVEKNTRNRTVQVQIVGDTFLYGNNYIYEPVYHVQPVIFTHFWAPVYNIWYSPWHWNYYPVFFNPWTPFPIYTYRSRVFGFIGVNNYCNFVNFRRSHRAIALHNTYRGRDWERMHPNRSFTARNGHVNNRQDLVNTRTNNGRNMTASNETSRGNTIRANNAQGTRNNNVRRSDESASNSNYATTRGTQNNVRDNNSRATVRGNNATAVTRGNSSNSASTSINATSRNNSSSNMNSPTRSNSSPSVSAPTRSSSSPSMSAPTRRSSSPSMSAPTRSSSSPSMSAPTRRSSSPSMSAPSRSSSSPSMSAPSRSSSSSNARGGRG